MTSFGGNFLVESVYFEVTILERLGWQIWAEQGLFENTMKGNEGPKGQNERK